MAKVFVSYSRKDIEFAKRLTGELQKSELDFWVDWEDIPPTVDWWKQIKKGIEEADAFLFLVSPDSAKSKIRGQEIDSAVKNGKRIIPIVVREIEWDDTLPQLGHLNYIFFSRDDDFDTAVKKLKPPLIRTKNGHQRIAGCRSKYWSRYEITRKKVSSCEVKICKMRNSNLLQAHPKNRIQRTCTVNLCSRAKKPRTD